MLRPEDFVIGGFANVDTEGLTLILPRRESEHQILITSAPGEKTAIYLNDRQFRAIPCGDQGTRGGLLIPNVRIEVDELSLFDPFHEDAPLGAVIREGTTLGIVSEGRDEFYLAEERRVPLITRLPACPDRFEAGFRKWRIVHGEGETARVLADFKIGPS